MLSHCVPLALRKGEGNEKEAVPIQIGKDPRQRETILDCPGARVLKPYLAVELLDDVPQLA